MPVENKLLRTSSWAWHKGPDFIWCLAHGKHSVVYHISLNVIESKLPNWLICLADWGQIGGGGDSRVYLTLSSAEAIPEGGVGGCPAHINFPPLGTALDTVVSSSDHVHTMGPCPG